MAKPQKNRGRRVRRMPERTDATPGEMALAMFKMPASHKWKCLDEEQDQKEHQPTQPKESRGVKAPLG